jgi:hypothetical protein
MKKVGRLYGHLEYITAIWHILWSFGDYWQFCILSPVFGILCKEKSGNPGRRFCHFFPENERSKRQTERFAHATTFVSRSVTRSGEFSFNGRLFTVGSVTKIIEVAQIFGYCFPKYRLCITFCRNGLCYILGGFLQTHLVSLFVCSKPNHCTKSKKKNGNCYKDAQR